MMVKAIGDSISMSEYNGLVYLLRKFKKIVRHETINKTILETDIGNLNITSGFINVGENFILENDVRIISQNCIPLTTYSFTFYVINADTSEEIIEIPVTLSGDTDEYGNLEITIPENLLSDGEEIRRDFKIEVTFQEHEGVSPCRLVNLTLTTDKQYIGEGETATVTATLLDEDDDPLKNYTVYFNVNGATITKNTNNDGIAILTLTGTGEKGILNIKVLDKEINIIDYYFYDHAISADHNVNYWSGNWEISYDPDSTTIFLCTRGASNFCPSISPTQTDITKRLEFDTPYSVEFDVFGVGENVNLRVWDGNASPYAVYFNHVIRDRGHYILVVKENVIQLMVNNNLVEEVVDVGGDTSVSFVSTKTTEPDCKHMVFANLVIYNHDIFVPPVHNYNLSLIGTSIIETGDDTTVTATLTDNGVPLEGETLNYEIKHGSTTISTGTTSATDSNGQATISYTGTGVGDINVIVYKTSMSLQKTYEITDYWKIYSNEFSNTDFYNSVQTLNFTLPSGDFEITWEASSNRSGSNNDYIRIGSDDDNCILFGVIDGNQSLGYYIRENGSYTHQTRGTVTGSVNNYMEHKITVVNGVITYNTADLILPSNTVSLEKFMSRTVWYGKSKNIKIKAL